MTPFRNRLKTPEEIELDHKYRQLSRLKSELQQRELDYRRLKGEIRLFEQIYEDILGVRISELEELEWQLKGLISSDQRASTEPATQSSVYTHFDHTTDLLDDEPLPGSADLSLKSLYRGVAKAVHPDLAVDAEDQQRRQELMALANQAYQSGNRQILIDLLSEWEQAPLSFSSETDIALELVRVIRQIAAVNQNIHALVRQTEELQHSDIYHFKLRVDDALADGADLLAEMAATVEHDIEKVRRRLALLRNETPDSPSATPHHAETRIVRFPVDKNCGTLHLRKVTSVDFRDWHSIGIARGAREIFLDTALRLDVRGATGNDMTFLAELQQNDLQALFLYACDDAALSHITHLSGLQELCLSDTSITDQGLAVLQHLHALQRISIYNTPVGDRGLANLVAIKSLQWLTCSGTAISDDGFNQFRRIKPFCKTVNFAWQYR
ncbi:MAG TPA: hypothetical protein HPP94_05610 [Desulfuromonadales bacterium]|nr:hypothetical protein [Desulfuromonadales bacterium]